MAIVAISAAALAGSIAVCLALTPVVWYAVRFAPADRVRDLLIVAAAFGWIYVLAQSAIRTYRLVAHGGWWLDHQWYAVVPDLLNILAAVLVLVAFSLVRWRGGP